jgi:hypothetical protein
MTKAAPPPWPSADGHRLVFAAEFDAGTLPETRHQVSRAAGQCGMPHAQIDDFAIAVNEIMTNAVRHGGGCGKLRLWCDGQLLGRYGPLARPTGDCRTGHPKRNGRQHRTAEGSLVPLTRRATWRIRPAPRCPGPATPVRGQCPQLLNTERRPPQEQTSLPPDPLIP